MIASSVGTVFIVVLLTGLMLVGLLLVASVFFGNTWDESLAKDNGLLNRVVRAIFRFLDKAR